MPVAIIIAEITNGYVEILRNGLLPRNSIHNWKIHNLIATTTIKTLVSIMKKIRMGSVLSLKEGM